MPANATTVRSGVYRHFKGKLCLVVGVARHSETLEEFVVYREPYDEGDPQSGALWIRPVAMFLETVARDGKGMPRFTFIREEP